VANKEQSFSLIGAFKDHCVGRIMPCQEFELAYLQYPKTHM
jgi:hypothetical protein